MSTIAIALGCIALFGMFVVGIRLRKSRRQRELLAARRAKYNPHFEQRRRHIQNIRGRQVEDLDEDEIIAYQQRDVARNQNIQFLRLIVSDLFDEEELEPEQEEEQREELLVERQSWIEENQEGLNEHAALVEEEEIGSGVTVMETIAPEEDDIEERLEREGGKAGEVQLSLAWDDYNDLDMHVFCPSGERIYFNNKKSECGGELDVDMNVRPVSNNPVENVVWTGEAPPGKYKIGVHFYKHHRKRRSKKTTTFRLRVMVHGKSRDYSGTISSGSAMQMVTSFTLKPNSSESGKSMPI
ncbi:MAG TPA: DUF2135 domain-containing protein [Candidatus Poseidoniales archaeon]|nr:MAG TPA: DUF2135 domain-containing protein [Candidatus Poseidoniales archaeon]